MRCKADRRRLPGLALFQHRAGLTVDATFVSALWREHLPQPAARRVAPGRTAQSTANLLLPCTLVAHTLLVVVVVVVIVTVSVVQVAAAAVEVVVVVVLVGVLVVTSETKKVTSERATVALAALRAHACTL